MEKKKLYMSLSLIAVAAMLTACGDGNKTDVNSAGSSVEKSQQNTFVPTGDLSIDVPAAEASAVVATQEMQRDVEDASREGDAVLLEITTTQPELSAALPPAEQPQYDALVKTLGDLKTVEQDVSAKFLGYMEANTHSSYAEAGKKLDEYKLAIGASAKELSALREAYLAAKDAVDGASLSPEITAKYTDIFTQVDAYMTRVANLHAENYPKTLEGYDAFRVAQQALIESYAKAEKVSPAAKLAANLQKKFTGKTFPSETTGRPLKLSEEKGDDGVTQLTAKIAGAFREAIINGNIQKAELDLLVTKVYTAVKSLVRVSFPTRRLGLIAVGTVDYTLDELQAIINAPATASARDTTVEGLNPKVFPSFNAKDTVKDGKKPDQAYYDAVILELDATVPLIIKEVLKEDGISAFFPVDFPKPAASSALALSSGGVMRDMSGMLGFSDARRLASGKVNAAALNIGGVNGGVLDVAAPVFVQLQGTLNTNKTAEAALGSVAYRMGDTVIGAIQGYATEGVGFTSESRQLETSVMVSQNLGAMFVEGQVGVVSAEGVHGADWSGLRSHVRVGMDTAVASPFVEVSYRNLSKDTTHQLNETVGSLGLEVDLGSQTAHNYSLSQKLFGKVGYGSEAWSTVGGSHLGDVSTPHASIQWSSTLAVSGGVGFSTNLGLSSSAGASLAVSATLDR